MVWRYVAGGVAALLLVTAGVVMFKSPARSTSPLAAAPPSSGQDTGEQDALPEASERTREQKRFDRYDKDRNGAVTREEYLANRRKAYAKLDANHDGQLSFDEWAVKATTKFAAADKDKSGAMAPAEFATTAVKRAPKRQLRCPPTKAGEEES